MDATHTHNWVPFSSLPMDPSGPEGNAWGRFGPADALGMLNLLTPSTIARAAATEIKTGLRVSLDWPLNKPDHPLISGRARLEHKIRNRAKGPDLRCINDDWLGFDTQSGSQWDGFRHFGKLDMKRYYNGATHEQVLSDPTVQGIDAWAQSGGITGRGVLLDYASWAGEKGIQLRHWTRQTIPVAHLIELVKDYEITFVPGDVLFIRSGFTAAYEALTESEKKALGERPVAEFLGVEAHQDTLKWLWEHQFAAVAGDSPSFEAGPPMGVPGTDQRFVLHEWLLAGWGCPIGEMFDLELLSRRCKNLGRWSFFVCSVPLKVPGGVASPPNAVAIF